MWKNNTPCPHYIAPRYVVARSLEGIEHDYESVAMCELVDKFCLMEHGDYCETYEEFFKELSEDEWLDSDSPIERSCDYDLET